MRCVQISDTGGGPRLPSEEVDARCGLCLLMLSRPADTRRGHVDMCSVVDVVSGEDGECWKASIYDVRKCPWKRGC